MADEAPSDFGAATLKGRVALVTGGTRGIGAAICTTLAAGGADVAAMYNGNTEAAEAFRSAFDTKFPGPLGLHRGNVGSLDDSRRVVAEVLEQHGRLDILVNNAGTVRDSSFLTMSEDDWNSVLEVNLSGAFFMSQAALRHMLERGTGRIINVGSIIGETGNIGQANYAASKSGLLGMSKSLALECAFLLKRQDKPTAPPGLTVNVVSPGVVATEMVKAIPDKVRNRLYGQIPHNRFASPEEIASVVRFLADDSASYVTGQAWSVNGGMNM